MTGRQLIKELHFLEALDQRNRCQLGELLRALSRICDDAAGQEYGAGTAQSQILEPDWRSRWWESMDSLESWEDQ